jgi:hypothetical protein
MKIPKSTREQAAPWWQRLACLLTGHHWRPTLLMPPRLVRCHCAWCGAEAVRMYEP